MIAQYPSLFELCTDAASVRRAHAKGKIASMIGVEGGHQTGNSLGALRMFFESGVRYMTITHNSDNAFGTCWKSVDLESGKDAGLTSFGQDCIREMNRLGMMVDLAHVSPKTMRDVLRVARAPVIFSHSGAYSVNKHLRNVPDDVIKALKTNGGIVMIPAIAPFMNTDHPDEATVEDMIDHILWVADLAGWGHVGLGSDFDGSTMVVKGLEV
jgi:membrane dipeptidase